MPEFGDLLGIFIQRSLHFLEPVLQTVFEFAVFFMVLFVLFKGSSVRTAVIQAANDHLVDECDSNQIGLNCYCLLLASWTTSFTYAFITESMRTRMQSYRIVEK